MNDSGKRSKRTMVPRRMNEDKRAKDGNLNQTQVGSSNDSDNIR